MVELFIKLLRNPGFAEDTTRLLKNITVDYLRSHDCHEKLVRLIVMEVLRNERVLKELFVLSKEFAEGKERDM